MYLLYKLGLNAPHIPLEEPVERRAGERRIIGDLFAGLEVALDRVLDFVASRVIKG